MTDNGSRGIFKSATTDNLLKRVRVFEACLMRRGDTYQYNYEQEDRDAIFKIYMDEEKGLNAYTIFSNLREVEISILDIHLPKGKERLLIKMMDPSIIGAGLKLLTPSIEFMPGDIDCISDDSTDVLELPGEYTLSFSNIYRVPEGYSDKQISEYIMGDLLEEIREEAMSVIRFFKENGVEITPK